MLDIVKDYYGRQLQKTADLKTTACCDISTIPDRLKPLLARVHPDVTERYYGCGLVCPPLIEGARILDLGCGAGRDVFLLAQLVGPQGEVVGVDMTEEQLAVAHEHRDWHAAQAGFSNTSFHHGYIERLDELGLEPASFDVIVSNCVVNLSTDKQKVLDGVRALLKPGGEFYFSDVYADRRLPQAMREDPLLYGECLGGALYWNDFLRIARRAGFIDPRLVEDRKLAMTDSIVEQRVGNVAFHSATYRLFAISGLEDSCEDFGQAVVYRGTVADYPDHIMLDKHHSFETGRAVPVCGNSFLMLKESRFAPHFDFIGDTSRHFGLFRGCGESIPFDGEAGSPISDCC